MGVRGPVAAMLTVLLAALTAGCAPATAGTGGPPSARHAPDRPYPVAVRTITIDQAGPRPLPVTLWYPTEDGRVAPGRFPVVVHSHGLHSLPELHAGVTTRWAAAGFVVAAPTYPHTSARATRFIRADVRHQPADGWRLIRHLVRLDTDPADPLAGHLDVTRFAAAGHRAGGFPTAGMFTSGHSARLRSGIVLAGGGLPGAFAAPAAPLLFVHGTADPVVPVAVGRAAYGRVAGPAAFLSVLGQGHGEYLIPGRPGFEQVLATTTDFLRWTLYDDRAARGRLAADATLPGVTALDDRLRP